MGVPVGGDESADEEGEGVRGKVLSVYGTGQWELGGLMGGSRVGGAGRDGYDAEGCGRPVGLVGGGEDGGCSMQG